MSALEILKQETKYFNLINQANAGEVIEFSDDSSLSSEEQLDETKHPKKEPLDIIHEATSEEELMNTL